MALDVVSMILSNSFTEESLIGGGAVKGKNCTVSTIDTTSEGSEVKFLWTLDDGTQKTSTLKIKNGISVTSVDLDETTNKLTCTLSDGSIQECGIVNVVTDVSKIEYTPSVDATIHTVEDALNKLITKTDAELENPLTCSVAMGNIVSGTTFPKGTPLEEIVRQMLTQYIKPTVNLVLNPSTTLYDKIEDSVSSITLNAIVTKKTSDIAKVEFYVNNTLAHTITSNVVNGGTFPYIYSPATPINDNTTFRVVVTDIEDGEGTMSKAIEFCGKSYYGIVSADLNVPSESVIKALNSTLKNTKKFVYEGITTDWGKVCYAYPKSMSDLVSIKDEVNSFNYTNSFAKNTVTVDGIEYLVYTQIDASSASNVQITFA